MGHKSVGTIGPDPHCMGTDVGCGHCRIVLHDRALALPDRGEAAEAICGAQSGSERGGDSGARAAAHAHGAAVSLDHGGVDAHAADYGVSAQGGRAVQLGALPLDRGRGADGFDPLSHCAFDVLSGFLVDLAGQNGFARCDESDASDFSARMRRCQPSLRSIRSKTSCITARSCWPGWR